MNFCVIGSGSKGNLTYVETSSTKILIDAGISLTDAARRTPNIDYRNIDAILITHEHIDHRKYLATMMKKTNATLYISKLSFAKLPIDVKKGLVDRKIIFIEANKKYIIKDLEILTLELSHDSASIFGFIIVSDDKRLAYLTDTGFIPTPYIELLKSVDALIIEANHDITMLMESNREWFLKERILSPRGHMSNYICTEILKVIINERHKIILLAHVSEECNSFEIIENDIIKEIKKIYFEEIVIAYQYQASQLYTI